MEACLSGQGHLSASLDCTFNFTGTYLASSSFMAREAKKIESTEGDVDAQQHLGLVTASIIQSVAALESTLWILVNQGPGAHRGSSDPTVAENRKFLEPIADLLTRNGNTLEKFQNLLHILRKPTFDRGAQPWQDADLVVWLRNELVHYKAKSGTMLEKERKVRRLLEKAHSIPVFRKRGHYFFPLQALNADCAAWAHQTCKIFLRDVYRRLGFEDLNCPDFLRAP